MRGKSIVLAALFALATYIASAQLSQTIQDDNQFLECLLDPEEIQNLDYSNVKSMCDPSVPLDLRCQSCLCALADVFAESIANTGLPPINFASLAVPESPEAELAQQYFLACFDVIIPALNTNGIQLNAFTDLQQCEFEQVPECLVAAPTAESL